MLVRINGSNGMLASNAAKMAIPEDLLAPLLPAAYGVLLIEVAVHHGARREQMLDGIFSNTESLNGNNGKISHVQCARLIERALTLTNRPELGVEFGLRNSPLIHGSVGHGFLSLPKFREAINFAIRYSNLITIGIDSKLVESDESASIIFFGKLPFELIRFYSQTVTPEMLRRCVAEMFTVGWWAVLQRSGLFSEATPVIHFDFPRPAYFDAYTSILPPVKFDSDRLAIEFPRKVLDQQINLVDDIAARIAEEQCQTQLRSLGMETTLIDKVLSVIARIGYDPHPRLELVAEQLNLSSRTLKRRLHEQGTNYEKLLNQRRQADCFKLLGNPSLSIDAIGQKLGYSSQNNFHRAFRGWTGTSPSAYRKRQLGEPR